MDRLIRLDRSYRSKEIDQKVPLYIRYMPVYIVYYVYFITSRFLSICVKIFNANPFKPQLATLGPWQDLVLGADPHADALNCATVEAGTHWGKILQDSQATLFHFWLLCAM